MTAALREALSDAVLDRLCGEVAISRLSERADWRDQMRSDLAEALLPVVQALVAALPAPDEPPASETVSDVLQFVEALEAVGAEAALQPYTVYIYTALDHLREYAQTLTLLEPWRPIASAPHEGEVLIAWPSGMVRSAHRDNHWSGGPCWTTSSGMYFDGTGGPTHWMPLPPAPTVPRAEEG